MLAPALGGAPWALALASIACALLLAALVIPVTRQFFLPFLPLACYLVLFYSCKFIPSAVRPEPRVSRPPAPAAAHSRAASAPRS